VDADAHLHLVVGEVERRRADRRDGARRERHAHAATAVVDAPRDVGHQCQVSALLGGRARDLLDEHGDPDAAAPGREEAVLDRDVVVRHDGHHLGAVLGSGELGRHLEVHDVARVVLHDVQHTRTAVDEVVGGEHLVGGGGGEHLAGTGGVEHPPPDVPAVQGLVPGAPS